MPKYVNLNGLGHFWDGIKSKIAQDDGFYDEITTKTGRVSDTDYYITTVPKYDSNGEQIELFVARDDVRNPLQYAAYAHTTLTINGNATILTDDNIYNAGATIGNGVVLNDETFFGREDEIVDPLVYEKYIGFKADRSIIEYDMSEGISNENLLDNMIADGCQNVFNCYFKLMTNGVMIDLDNAEPRIKWNGSDPIDSTTKYGPFMLLGVKTNGDLVFMTTDARTSINIGMTYPEVCEIMRSEGCVDVYNLDGGGSASMIVRGSKVNRNIDGSGTSVRNIHYTINFAKRTTNTAVQSAFAQVGVEKQRIIGQLIPLINAINVFTRGKAISKNEDLNDIVTVGKYYSANAETTNTISNRPDLLAGKGFTMFVVQLGRYDENVIQFIVTNNPTEVHYRVVYPPDSYRPWQTLSDASQKAVRLNSHYYTAICPDFTSGNYVVKTTWFAGTIMREDCVYYDANAIQVRHDTSEVPSGAPTYSVDESGNLIVYNAAGVTIRVLVSIITLHTAIQYNE